LKVLSGTNETSVRVSRAKINDKFSKVCGPKTDELSGQFWILHNEKRHGSYRYPVLLGY